MTDTMARWGSLTVFVLLVVAAAWTGSNYRPGEWYASLSKPDFTPPNWLFPVAWTILYAMIAIAGWRVWKAGGGLSAAVVIWGVGLLLNASWSYVMFGAHEIGWALINVYALLAAVFAFIVAAWPIDRAAALMFVPYALWVSFASMLNFAIWQLNP